MECNHAWIETKFWREWNDSWDRSVVCSKCGEKR